MVQAADATEICHPSLRRRVVGRPCGCPYLRRDESARRGSSQHNSGDQPQMTLDENGSVPSSRRGAADRARRPQQRGAAAPP